MNTVALLSLIADLYAQIAELQRELRTLKEATDADV
jgi:hypothetical protein